MAGFLENLGEGLNDVLQGFTSALGGSLSKVLDSTTIVNALDDVDVGMTKIINTMGGGRELSYLIKNNIAGAFTDVKLLGGSLDDIVKIQQDLVNNTNKQVVLQKEYYDDLFATTQVTGEYAGTLINAFDNAGKSVYDIKGTMEGVVNQSRALGLDAQEVSSRMVSNLDKMNMYGFERGIQGLSKMAATSAMFKMDMSSTFNLADKLMGPEQAVEFSARLQALGIQSELVDPFRAMDLATNNVEELQNQIVKLGEGMTFVNEKGDVEIFKEKRGVIKELAAAAGMGAAEFAKLVVQSETARLKMAEIKMPDLNVTEEQKTMIANLATMKEGPQGKGYYVQFEDKQGKTQEKLVSEIKEGDLQAIADQYANPKDMIDLAKDQIDFLSSMAHSLEAIEKSGGMSIAGSKLGGAVVDLSLAANDLILEPIAKALDTKGISKSIDDAGDNLKDIYSNITNVATGFDGTVTSFTGLFSGTLASLGDAVNRASIRFEDNFKKVEQMSLFKDNSIVQTGTSGINPPPSVRDPKKIGELNDGFVFGDGNSKQVVQTHPDDNGFFAQREGMLKMMGGGDIIEKMKEMTREANSRNNIDTNMMASMSRTMSESMSKSQDVNHKMEKIEGDIKVTMDFSNVPPNLDTRMLSEAFKNNQGLVESLVNSIRKKMDNNGVTNAPSDYNQSYLRA
jgi:hypothetical protein